MLHIDAYTYNYCYGANYFMHNMVILLFGMMHINAYYDYYCYDTYTYAYCCY